MSGFLHKHLWIALVGLSAGCASLGPPVRVYGEPQNVERLAGDWWGEYVGNWDHRRQGSISFKLVAGEQQAHGDVLMIPEGTLGPYGPYYGDDAGRRPLPPPNRLLTIRFVAIDRDSVSGLLDDYWDPDRRTTATSTFVGRVGDDVIEGTFTTRYASREPETKGRWKVTRSRP